MILSNVNTAKYKEDFKTKFTNFGEKSPIILSFATDELGVTIIHENSGKQYFYEWDYSVPLKSFIHLIKQDLIRNHYPRIARKEIITKPVTPERASELLIEGISSDQIPVEEKEEKLVTYRIDKILAMKDEFIIVNDETSEQYCYKMKGSGIYFLKNYREGAYKTLEEAGDAFFKKSTLVSKLEKLSQ